MRLLIAIYSLLICATSYANMASPIIRGTLSSRPFVNEYVNVVHEDLRITIGKRFQGAHFHVKYHIESSKTGTRIPLLFYASEYIDGFKVRVDGKEMSIQPVPNNILLPEGTEFNDFSYLFDFDNNRENESIPFNNGNYDSRIEMRNLLYFEVDLTEGAHIIEVDYNAEVWTDRSTNWINKYSFRYALSPAKYWKSFGTLTVTLDATRFNESIGSNLGEPVNGSTDSIATWQFDSLPMDVAQWTFNPTIPPKAKRLIEISPFGLGVITGLVCSVIHFVWMWWFRRRNPTKKHSFPLIVGSILVPLIFLISWINYYGYIDDVIGVHASRYRGYVFLYIVLYPVVLLVYWVLFWLIDLFLRKRTSKKINS